MAGVSDRTLRKGFADLHEKTVDTTQKLRLADSQIESLRRKKQLAELTKMEVTSLPVGTKIYEPVGRMFFLDDVGSIKEELEKEMKSADEKIKTLENNKTLLQESLNDCENNMREMVRQRKK